MATRRFLVTAALPYSNGRLHVGHVAGAYLPADTYVRYLRARGDDVRFVCGSDDNGVAALISARKEGRSVEELTASYHARQAADFAGLDIRFDVYGGTHQPGYVELHERLSQGLFRRIHDAGYFIKRETEQLFDVEAGRFLPDRFVQGRCYHRLPDGRPCANAEAYGDQCEACGQAIDPLRLVDPLSTISGTRPVRRPTTHWHLRLDRFEEPLRRWLEDKRRGTGGEPPWRDWVVEFTLSQIERGLPERAMTRDLDWGVPVPLDDPDARGKVLYVWFDAPVGYVSFTAAHCRATGGDWRDYERWWKDPDCRIVHFLGQDNTLFHALIWPAMLMAEGTYELPRHVVVNAFLNLQAAGGEEQKFSKSRGNAIWIEDYLRHYPADPLRYYLTAIAPEARSTAFEPAGFVARNNGELLNAFGNFVHRTLTFAERYFEARVPGAGARGEIDRAHLAQLAACAASTTEHLEAFRFKAALAEVMAFARACNGYFDAKQPWKQRKDDPLACGATINACVQSVRGLATLIAPFLPATAERCREMLGLAGDGLPWAGATAELSEGHRLGTPRILFEKLESFDPFPAE